MFLRKQVKLDTWLSNILILLLSVFCINTIGAQREEINSDVNPEQVDMIKKYNTLSAAAPQAFTKHITDPSNTEALERLVSLSNDFLTTYPSFKRIGEVNYYLGKALVQLGRVENGIVSLEKMITDTSPNHIAETHYPDNIGDVLRWSPLEHGLLELGLAHDKLKQYDKADTVYKKLITHPAFGDGLQARIARGIIELDIALRTGEVSKPHNAWIGQTAPNFRMRYGKDRQQLISLNQFEGHVVLFYYGNTDTQNLAQLHEKYKDKLFQIISVNADVSESHTTKAIEEKGDAWIHYHDNYGKVVDMFQIRTLPVLFLIDSEGVIRKTQLDAASLEKAVDELVKENFAKYDDLRTQTVIAKAVKAHGGREKLMAVKNMTRDYSLFIALPDGTLHKYGGGKAYLYPNKYRSDFYSTDGGNYRIMSDGKMIYFSDGNTVAKLDDDKVEMQMQQEKDMAFREPIWLLKTLAQSKIPVEYVGIENVEDEPASVLSVKQPSGIPIKLYISSKTHHLVKIVIEGETDKVVKLFKVFKDVDGIILPHQSITITDDEHHETHFSNAILNAEIAPQLFDPKELAK